MTIRSSVVGELAELLDLARVEGEIGDHLRQSWQWFRER
jgi:hypothetical protein